MKIVLAAGLAVAGGLLSMGIGAAVANADDVLVAGNYATSDGCEADGAAGGGIAGTYTHYTCSQHDDGLWYLTMHN